MCVEVIHTLICTYTIPKKKRKKQTTTIKSVLNEKRLTSAPVSRPL